jgi:TP901 family phage tail tape measure protein
MAERLGVAELETGVDQSGIDRGLGEAKRKSKGFVDEVSTSFRKNLGSSLGQGIGVGIGAIGADLVRDAASTVVSGFKDMVGSAVAFEQGMRNVNSIAKVTEAELAAMGDAALAIGAEFGQSAATMTDALYDISSSGFAGSEALDILRASALAATAGMATTGQAAAGITAVLNSYGMAASEAGRVSDILFKTVERGVVTFPELSDQIGKVAALAAPLGVSLEEVGAALAVMTRAGIDAENATTQLNAIMSSILKPSKEASDLARQLGIDWTAAGLKANGLSGTLSRMLVATNGNQEAMATLLGDARAIRGAFSLAADSGQQLSDELAIMEDAAGAAGDAFGEQSKGAAFKLAQMQSKLEAAGIELGQKMIPVLLTLADATIDYVVPAIETLAGAFALLTGDIEPAEDALRGFAETVGEAQPVKTNWLDAQIAALEEFPTVVVKGAGRAAQGMAFMRDAAKDDLRIVADEYGSLATKAADASTIIERTNSDILASIRGLRDGVVGKGDEVADALYRPIIVAGELADTQQELRIIKSKLANDTLEADERESLERRRQTVGQKLIELTSEHLTYGTRAEQINKTSAFLSSSFWTDAYEGASVEQKIILDDWRRSLEERLDGMVNSAEEKGGQVRDKYTGEIASGRSGVSTATSTMVGGMRGPLTRAEREARKHGETAGQAYADGVAAKVYATANAAARHAAQMRMYLRQLSPAQKGPLSEGGGTGGWGEKGGDLFIDGIVRAIGRSHARLTGALGGVRSDLSSLRLGATASLTGGLAGGLALAGGAVASGVGVPGGTTVINNNSATVQGLLPVRSPLELTDQMDRLARSGEWMTGPRWRDPV